MGQVFGLDRAGALTVASTTSVTLGLDTYGSDIRGTIGGQQYRSTSAITINAATTGANALDTGALAANKAYYVHYVLSGNSLALVASLSKTSPTGFSLSRWTGYMFATNGSSQIFQAGTASAVKTVQNFTSGSGTYTTPTGCTSIKFRMVGGGGGGAGSGAAGQGTQATAGGSTTFASCTAAGGGLGPNGVQATGGDGGTGTLASGVIGFVVKGGTGGGSAAYNSGAYAFNHGGGSGGNSAWGGGSGNSPANSNSNPPGTNSGGGGSGSGGSTIADMRSGAGGGAGGYVEGIIVGPATSYSYGVGTGGNGGAPGSGGGSGNAGAAGQIVVEEFYG